MRFTPSSVCTLAAAIVMLSTSSVLYAQTDYSRGRATRIFTLGLFAEGGLSHSFEGRGEQDEPLRRWDPEEVAPGFAFRTGAALTYPIDPTLGATLSLGIDRRSYGITRQGVNKQIIFPGQDTTLSTDERTRLTYLSIMPGMQFSTFHLGLNIGIPMSGVRSNDSTSLDFNDEQVDEMNVMIEPRIGAIIPLLDQEIGWLGLMASAGYALNAVAKEINSQGQTVDTPYQFASLHLGLTWQFALGRP